MKQRLKKTTKSYLRLREKSIAARVPIVPISKTKFEARKNDERQDSSQEAKTSPVFGEMQ